MTHHDVVENLIKTQYGDNPYIKFLEVGVLEGYMERFLISKFDNIEITCVDKNGSPFSEQESKRIKHIEGLSSVVASSFCEKTFDFVWLDGSHEYNDVMEDIKKYKPLVKNHGIFGGHDYHETHGVIKALRDSLIDPILAPDLAWYTQVKY